MRLADIVSQVKVVARRDPQLLRVLSDVLVRRAPSVPDVIYVYDVVRPCLREVYLSYLLGHRHTAFALRSSSIAPIVSALRDSGWGDGQLVVKDFRDFRLIARLDAVRERGGDVEAAIVCIGRLNLPSRLLAIATAALTGWRTYLITLLPSGRLGGATVFDLTAEQRDAVVNAVTIIARQLHQAFSNRQPPPPERGPWCVKCPYQQLCFTLTRMRGVVPRA